MHNVFTDNRRRHLNLREPQVQSVLPEHFADAYPKFIKLLEEYYEWQGEYEATELLNHLFASRDINETDVTLLSFIEDELLLGENYFEGFGQSEAEKRAAANFSSTLFRAKGSKFAIEWFFRSFYGLDAEVLYPKEDIFNVSDGESRIGPDYLNFLTDDKLYQTYALLIRVGIPISQWSEVFKKFVHPAGMYLGSEVLLASDNISNMNLPNDSAVARTSTSFTLTNDGPTDEGQTTNFRVVANNVPEKTGVVYAYVTHGSTTDADFPLNAFTIPAHGPLNRYPAINKTIPLLTDSGGATLININNDSATFSIRSWVDSDGGASSENYLLHIMDHEGRALESTTVTINNVEPSYSLVPSSETPNEGDVITYTITGSNTPYDGETSLFYHLVHGGTNDSDFTVPPQQVVNDQTAASEITLSGGTGSFSLKTIIDGASDDAEEFTVNITDSKKLQVATRTVSVQQVATSFVVSADNIVEGNSLLLTVVVNTAEIGDSLTYVITNGDARIGLLTETFTAPSESFVKVIPTSVSSLYQGTITPTISVTNNVTGITVTTTFQLSDVTPVWDMTSEPEFAVQGDQITFKVDGTNLPDPTTVWFEILHGTTTNADFTSTPPQTGTRSSTAISDPGDTVFQITVDSDGEVADESFTARLYDADAGGNLLASIPYVIQGTNTSYVLTPSVTTVNEGGQVTFTFTTNQPDGTYYWYIPTYSGYTIQVEDFKFPNGGFGNGYPIGTNDNRYSFVVTGGTGTILVELLNDTLTEGAESFNCLVSTSANASVPPIASSANVTVNDTSITIYSVTSNNPVEGSTLDIVVTATNQTNPNSETLYIEVTGSPVVGRIPTQQFASTSSSYIRNIFVSTTSSTTYQGTSVGGVSVSRGNYASLGGTLIDSVTFQLVDQAPAMTLTPNATTGTEGDTVTYTVGGTNIQNGTYYWYDPAIVKTLDCPNGRSSGTSQIDHQGPSNLGLDLEVGMSTDDADIPGTITSVINTGSTTGYITMSEPTTRATVTGEHIKFAFPADWADATELYGTVAVSSNAGTFELDTLVNSDFNDDVYSMRVFDNLFSYNTYLGANLGLATAATVTIADTNPASVNLQYNTGNSLSASFFNVFGNAQVTTLMTEYNDTGQGIVWKNFTPHYASSSPTEDFGNPAYDNNWILPVEARQDYIGSNYQMNVRFYNDSQRTIATVPDQSTGGGSGYSYVNGQRFVDGVEVDTWDNSATQWWVVGSTTESGTHYFRHIAQTTPTGGSANVSNFRWVTVTIKEFSGTLGTGTTLLTYNYQSYVSAVTETWQGGF